MRGAVLGLRALVEEDEGLLWRLFMASQPQALEAPLMALMWGAQRRGYAAQFPSAEDRVILVGEAAVGRMLVSREPGALRLVDIALLPEVQGQGWGTEALGVLFAEAAALGLPVVGQVAQQNPGALRLYLRLGFKVEGEEGPYRQLRRM